MSIAAVESVVALDEVTFRRAGKDLDEEAEERWPSLPQGAR
jgi:hypothetical protein